MALWDVKRPSPPSEGFSCYSSLGRVKDSLDTRRVARPAVTGFCFALSAARPIVIIFRFQVRVFFHFSRHCRKRISFEDIHGREAEAQDVHQRVAW